MVPLLLSSTWTILDPEKQTGAEEDGASVGTSVGTSVGAADGSDNNDIELNPKAEVADESDNNDIELNPKAEVIRPTLLPWA